MVKGTVFGEMHGSSESLYASVANAAVVGSSPRILKVRSGNLPNWLESSMKKHSAQQVDPIKINPEFQVE